MKLSDIKNGNLSAEWAEKGYELPKFDVEAVKAKTHAEPTWVHFGAGRGSLSCQGSPWHVGSQLRHP